MLADDGWARIITSIELPGAPELPVGVGQALELLLLYRFGHPGIHPEPLLDLLPESQPAPDQSSYTTSI